MLARGNSSFLRTHHNAIDAHPGHMNRRRCRVDDSHCVVVSATSCQSKCQHTNQSPPGSKPTRNGAHSNISMASLSMIPSLRSRCSDTLNIHSQLISQSFGRIRNKREVQVALFEIACLLCGLQGQVRRRTGAAAAGGWRQKRSLRALYGGAAERDLKCQSGVFGQARLHVAPSSAAVPKGQRGRSPYCGVPNRAVDTVGEKSSPAPGTAARSLIANAAINEFTCDDRISLPSSNRSFSIRADSLRNQFATFRESVSKCSIRSSPERDRLRPDRSIPLPNSSTSTEPP